jgi:hypothetical protein
MSTSVLEVAVPHSKIKSIRFVPVATLNSVSGSIELPSPLDLAPEYRQGGEIMVVLRKKQVKGPAYAPVSASANVLREGTTSVYYNPSFEMVASLAQGGSLRIPAGALPAPQIFSVAVHDTGDAFPMVDIFPEARLQRPASLGLKRIARLERARDSTQAPPTPIPLPPRLLGAPSLPASAFTATLEPQSAQPGSGGSSTVEFYRTGVIRAQAAALTQQAAAETAAVSANSTAQCEWYLAHPQTEVTFVRDLAPTGTLQLNWCEAIPPYVHMTVSNLNDSRERFTLPYAGITYYGSGNVIWRIPLQRITYWSTYTQAMINGFNWTGDSGFFSGGSGLPLGYVRTSHYSSTFPSGATLGDNRSTGGSADFYGYEPYPPPDGNKRYLSFPNLAGGTSLWGDDYLVRYLGGQNTVSSSTSIVRDGVCSTDTTQSRWSAVGMTVSGRMVFMSSVSGSTTTSAAELCPLFKALGIYNALRMDGSRSTAMTIDGVLKNPLTGLDLAVVGPSRYIPYALKVSWVGW